MSELVSRRMAGGNQRRRGTGGRERGLSPLPKFWPIEKLLENFLVGKLSYCWS